jgi:hypothetical protein
MVNTRVRIGKVFSAITEVNPLGYFGVSARHWRVTVRSAPFCQPEAAFVKMKRIAHTV